MGIQYISDGAGKTTGVYIPISEWKKLKAKFKDIDPDALKIPDWQVKEVQKRIGDYKKHSEQALDFDKVLDDIEKGL
ncbi:MAG: hypothetical protein EA362_01825 [Saprospirales bacterium]|nr:MAG: hypothetical protein EA362_01825 [Saprospirales bacterium]